MNFCAIPTMTISVIIYREMGTNPLKETKKKKKKKSSWIVWHLEPIKDAKTIQNDNFFGRANFLKNR